MKHKFLQYIVPLVLVSMLLIAFYAKYVNKVQSKSLLLGKQLPPFSIDSAFTKGQRFSSTSILGQGFVLNFFSSWCMSCRYEHPFLLRIAKEFKIPMYGVYTQDRIDNLVLLFQNLGGNPYKDVLVDSNGYLPPHLGLKGLPETFIIDDKGIIIYHYAGSINEKIFKDEITPLLQQLEKKL